jgi:hypothetical protein
MQNGKCMEKQVIEPILPWPPSKSTYVVTLNPQNERTFLWSARRREKTQKSGEAGDRNLGLPQTFQTMQSGRSTTEPHPRLIYTGEMTKHEIGRNILHCNL